MLENKKTKVQDVHYTRYIMSWLNAGGSVKDFGDEEFEKWLKSNEVDETEISEIREMCVCAGKLELEINAKPYIKAQKEYYVGLLKELSEEERKRKAEARPMNVLKRKMKATGPALKKALKDVGWF